MNFINISSRAASIQRHALLFTTHPGRQGAIHSHNNINNAIAFIHRNYSASKTILSSPVVKLSFILPEKKSENEVKVDVEAKVGENILRLAQRNDIALEGACEGVCACSTCHVILTDDFYDKLLDDESTEPSEDEEDMLDMAFGLTSTSRLGCQVKVTEDMEGQEFRLPAATRNFYVDGHVPQPH